MSRRLADVSYMILARLENVSSSPNPPRPPRRSSRPGQRGDWRHDRLSEAGAIRAGALVVVIVVAALAFASLLRPRNGYAGAHRLVLMLAIGGGVALVVLIAVAVVLRRRGDRSLWSAMTAVPTLSFVLALFVAASAVPAAAHWIRSSSAGSDSAAGTDFHRWQEAVVPIVVRWMDAVRMDNAFAHGFPKASAVAIGRRVHRSERTLNRLAHVLASDSSRLPQRPELLQLTRRLEAALLLARQAQKNFALALAVARGSGAADNGRAARIRRLVARGNEQVRRASAIMRAFSFTANDLGGSLFSGQP